MSLNTVRPEPAAWDAFVKAQGGHLLQTSRWGALKRDFGWSDQIVALGEGDRIDAGALVLFRALPFGLGSLAYVPRGPVVNWASSDAVDALINALDAASRARGAFALKVEPDARDTPLMRDMLARLGFRSSPQAIQPPRTILLDLTGSEDDILMRMGQTTRRKVRTGPRKGVEVRLGDASDLDSFNALMHATGERNAFGVHSDAYYRRAYELFAPEHAALIMASYEGRDLAGLMAFALGRTAWYLYGASSDAERERMPTYALQWEAIRWAKAKGCTVYDLWGVPDADEQTLEASFQTRSDGLWGVYGFKRGFGGEVVRSVGAWDRVYNPLLYSLYRLALAGRSIQG